MLKRNRFLAFLALFLGFYIIGTVLNFSGVISHSQEFKCVDLIKENKAHNSSLPIQFFELVDEKEINEDEQVKISHSVIFQSQSIRFSFLKSFFEKQVSLSPIYHQNYAVQVPRVILFHSWKYFIA